MQLHLLPTGVRVVSRGPQPPSSVPDDKEVRDVIEHHMSASANGMFTHVVDKKNSKLEAQIAKTKTRKDPFHKQVGQTTFREKNCHRHYIPSQR
jgi:hypothetical protein